MMRATGLIWMVAFPILVACAQAPAPTPPPSPPVFLPFEGPPPEPPLSQMQSSPLLNFSVVNNTFDEITLIGAKGVITLTLKPVGELPPDYVTAVPGVELRQFATDPSTAGYDPVALVQIPEDPPGLRAFARIFPHDRRLAACGYFEHDAAIGVLSTHASSRFLDLRSYLDIGGLVRLPSRFFYRVPEAAAEIGKLRENPTEKTYTIGDRTEKAVCVVSNIAWNPAYDRMRPTLHLVEFPVEYNWTIKSITKR